MKPQVIPLKHGVPLAIMEMPGMESVAVGVFVNVGSRHDPGPLSGLAHFAEHLFFKGTKSRTARQLSLATETLGGNADAFTSEEHTCFYLRGPAEDFEHFAEVLLDMFLNSTFPADEIERERDVISEEISMYQEQPASRAEDMLCQVMWPRHPLGRPISGDQKSLQRITRQHLLLHSKTYYGKRNIVLAVAGRIESSQVTRILNKLVGNRLPPGRQPTRRRLPRVYFGTGPHFKSEIRSIEQTQLALGFHAPGRDQPGTMETMKLLNVIVGENTSSRLWQELREKRGWCYQIDTDPTTLSDTGLFQVYAGIDPDNTEKSIRLILKELRRLAEAPVTKAELQRAISYTIGSNRLGLENSGNYMVWIGESLLFHGQVMDIHRSHDRLRKINPAQIQKLAASIFQPKHLGLAIVGPERQQDAISRALRTAL